MNLTGVTNIQNVTVTLMNVTDVAGNIISSVSATMAVLVGDTNVDRFVDAVDVSQTKSQAGNPVTNSNFREDVNANGLINSTDISITQSKSGTGLP